MSTSAPVLCRAFFGLTHPFYGPNPPPRFGGLPFCVVGFRPAFTNPLDSMNPRSSNATSEGDSRRNPSFVPSAGRSIARTVHLI
jgi:hypothetical protein